MNAKEMREVMEKEVVEAYKHFLECEKYNDPETHDRAVESCFVRNIFAKMFGYEALDALMEKHFPVKND